MEVTGRAAIALAVAACGSPVASGASDLATLGALGLRAMDPAILETTTKFLSSNELTGRGPGTEGGMRAEQHVADQLARIGLQPAGDHGTFFQEVPLRQARLIEAESSLVFHAGGTDIGLAHGRDAMLWPEPRDANVALERRVVFAGYGIARPDLGYDDLAGVDVKDAIVVIFGGAPRTLGGRALSSTVHAVLADTDPRSVVLKARGARAVIVVRDPVHAQVVSFEKFTQIAPRVSMAWLEGGVPASLPLLPTVSISEAAFERVLAATPGSPHAHALWAELDRGAPSHIEIAATATLRIRSELHDLVARNVLARLPR